MTEKVTSPVTYLLVCAALLVLTFATYEAALLNLGPWHTIVALGIAAVKAILIALFFMHARYSTGITRVVIGGGLLWLGILIVGTLDDVLTRGWLGIPGR
jgi:cytochrome c oxidase subunit 4